MIPDALPESFTMPDSYPIIRSISAEIIADVAHKHGLRPSDLKEKTQAHHIAHARQEAMWRLRQVKKRDGAPLFSYPRVARFFGDFDHTTAIHACRSYEARMAEGRG